MVRHPVVLAAFVLGLFAVVGTSLVALTHDLTAERIAANERAALLRSLHALVPPEAHDNDIATDVITVTDPRLLGTETPVTVYRARMGRQPVAAVLSPVAPDGYSGSIKLLVAARYDGSLGGVRVIAHRETPGLGDGIEAERSEWILQFAGLSLREPRQPLWKVKRDGGVFDQFTGATITPRAVVKAVKNSLLYFDAHRDALFALPEAPKPNRGDAQAQRSES